MIKYYNVCTALCCCFCLSLPAAAEKSDSDEEKFFSIDGSYTGEVLGNLRGGIRTGASYLGYATMGATFDTKTAHWWNGGQLRVSGGNTHGDTPTEKLIGDCQTVSNIEAGNHTFLAELWYKQQLGRFSITAGLQDLNASYAVCPYGENFINSSFGIFSTMSLNFSSPIFPITGLAIDFHYEINKDLQVQTALFDGNVSGFDDNPHNLKWDLNPEKGYLWVNEAKYAPTLGGSLEGCYSIGLTYHTQMKSFGIYTTAGQTFWRQDERNGEVFALFSYTPKKHNDNYMFIGGGVNLTGVFSHKGHDYLGLGVATAFFDSHTNETTLELTYKRQLGKHAYIQPDLQFVFHPAGSDEELPNALAGILRLGVEF